MAATTLPHQRTRDETALARLAAGARAHGPGILAALGRAGGRLRRLLLSIAAMVCLVVAAWMIAVPLGLLAASVCLLWLEWLTTPEAPAGRGSG